MSEQELKKNNADLYNEYEDEEDELADEAQLVIFKLGKEEYGVDIMQVKEIIRMTSINKVPQVPQFIEGIISLRGDILPILDLREKFGMDKGERTRATRIVVINIEGMTIGGIVDEVSEVLRIPNDAIKPPPPVIKGINSEYLKGVGQLNGRILIILDMSKILSTTEMIKIKDMSGAK